MKALGALAAAAAVVPFGLTPAQALPAGYGESVATEAVATLTADGLTTAEATDLLSAQPDLIATGERVLDRVGADSAGMYLDPASAAVVVNVVDSADVATVESAGATARVVDHSMAELTAARDAVAKVQPANTAAGIDVRDNQVVVRIADTATGLGALTAVTERFGDLVRTEHVAGAFDTAISGGDAITGSGGRCSLGFNTTGNTGITAGHCTGSISSWNDAAGNYYGPSIAANFPTQDYGLIRNDGGLAQPGDVNLYNGGYQDINGAADPYVGLSVCKSGSTTGLTCGQVTQVGITICYSQGCVYNMAESTAYVQPGDSGGAWFAGGTAIGITSGMGGGYSYFQPVVPGLNLYGVSVF
ncbi:MAG: S1 family peptidase [Actinophytocola sp.]|uniref:S1 family peptidase n=1 Tax=Actinophytocola sp. TaxID=1872138 RepID=UPI003C762447